MDVSQNERDHWMMLLGACIASTGGREEVLEKIGVELCPVPHVREILEGMKAGNRAVVVSTMKASGIDIDDGDTCLIGLIRTVSRRLLRRRCIAMAQSLDGHARLMPEQFLDKLRTTITVLEKHYDVKENGDG